MIRSITFLFVVLLVTFSAYSAESPDYGTLNQHSFIGQAYPSGNVYLRRFVEKVESKVKWPKQVQIVPITSNSNPQSIIDVQYVQALKSKVENNIEKSIYIPGIEGMDDSHASCGLGEFKKVDPKFKMISGDFFWAILDHCESNDGIAMFKGKSSNNSFLVIGVEKPFSLSKPRMITKVNRPLTDIEKVQIESEKKKYKSNSTGDECTTAPAFLDSANQLVEAQLDRSVSLRLSTYDDPGCGDHLASIYVLDILKNNKLVKSFTISQYRGVL